MVQERVHCSLHSCRGRAGGHCGGMADIIQIGPEVTSALGGKQTLAHLHVPLSSNRERLSDDWPQPQRRICRRSSKQMHGWSEWMSFAQSCAPSKERCPSKFNVSFCGNSRTS